MPAPGVAAMMSLARLSAGSGYRYLLRNTATGDVAREPGTALVDYYAASGTPPGRWAGAGLPGLGTGDGGDLAAGTAVSEEATARLYGSARDPITGKPLGRPYPTYRPTAERIAARVARLPDTLTATECAEAVAQIEAQEAARPVRSAVAGYDLTFTVPKSVSVLWALADRDVSAAVEAAHRDAVSAVLAVVEDRFLHTRIGTGSLIQVPARGAIAAGFDHFDTRAGDPNLHTHLVIANKVQGPTGNGAPSTAAPSTTPPSRAPSSTTPPSPTCSPSACPSPSPTGTADRGGPRRTRSTASPIPCSRRSPPGPAPSPRRHRIWSPPSSTPTAATPTGSRS